MGRSVAPWIALLAGGCALPHGGGNHAQDASRDAPAMTDGNAQHDVADAPAPDDIVEISCPSGEVECSGACTDLSSDPNHCGSCDVSCTPNANETALCSAGVCAAGPCVMGYTDCDRNAANGCETMGPCPPVASCAALPAGSPSGPYAIGTTTDHWLGFCEMTADGGGWTLVLKADGNQQTFTYSATLWTTTDTLNPTSTNLDRVEAKFEGFSTLAFHAVRIAMWDPTDNMVRSIVLDATAPSLRAVFASGTYAQTMKGRTAWEALMSSGSLQANCNMEGFNVAPVPNGAASEVRIGIVANEQNDCNSPNSRIGVGGAGATGSSCNPAGAATITVGNEAGCTPDNGDRTVRGFAYVFVR